MSKNKHFIEASKWARNYGALIKETSKDIGESLKTLAKAGE